MARTCPQCNHINSKRKYRCENCGTELVENGILLDTLDFWEDSKNKYALWSSSILVCAVAAAILLHDLIPVGVGLAVAGILYFKGLD